MENNRPILRSPHEYPNGSSARRRSNPSGNNNNQNAPHPPPSVPPSTASSGLPPPSVSRPVRANLLTTNGRGNSQDERRRSIVDPDGNFEKFLLKGQQADPSTLLDSPPKAAKELDKIRPPPLRPQHVYAPMPALGALSFLGGGKKSGDAEDDDFSRLPLGKYIILHSITRDSPNLNINYLFLNFFY